MPTWHDPLVETPNEDQRPDGWSSGAASYEEVFAPFTGAYAGLIFFPGTGISP